MHPSAPGRCQPAANGTSVIRHAGRNPTQARSTVDAEPLPREEQRHQQARGPRPGYRHCRQHRRNPEGVRCNLPSLVAVAVNEAAAARFGHVCAARHPPGDRRAAVRAWLCGASWTADGPPAPAGFFPFQTTLPTAADFSARASTLTLRSVFASSTARVAGACLGWCWQPLPMKRAGSLRRGCRCASTLAA